MRDRGYYSDASQNRRIQSMVDYFANSERPNERSEPVGATPGGRPQARPKGRSEPVEACRDTSLWRATPMRVAYRHSR